MPEGLPTKRTRRSCARTDVPLPWLSINAHVEARYRGSIRWSSGTILNRDIDDGDNPVYDVLFRDGCRDRKIPARNIRINEGGGAITGEGGTTDKLNTAVAHTQAAQLGETELKVRLVTRKNSLQEVIIQQEVAERENASILEEEPPLEMRQRMEINLPTALLLSVGAYASQSSNSIHIGHPTYRLR